MFSGLLTLTIVISVELTFHDRIKGSEVNNVDATCILMEYCYLDLTEPIE